MLNRYLSLLVAIVAPASAAAMLIAGAHPIGVVTLAERASCVGLAIVALTLAILHARAAPTGTTRAESAMWCGLSVFFFVATFALPHLGVWAIVATLLLAATSVARLVARDGHSGAVAQGPIRRRIFA